MLNINKTHSSFLLKNSINSKNLNLLKRTHKQYCLMAKSIMGSLMNDFYLYKKNTKFIPSHFVIKNSISARYNQTCYSQTKGIFDSYISNCSLHFKNIINKSNLTSDIKHKMHYINSFNLYFVKTISHKELQQYGFSIKIIDKILEMNISDEDLLLARKIFKKVLANNNFPRTSNFSLALDAKIATCKANEKSQMFNYWLYVSSYIKGVRIKIPLLTNSYFEQTQSEIKNFVQIKIINDQVLVRLMKEVDLPELELNPIAVAIDFGLVNLLNLDNGYSYGKGFIKQLSFYDKKIAAIKQSNGNNQQSYKIKKLFSRTRNFIKNETNRVLNNVMKNHKPSDIIVEKLNFKSSGLSPQLNRLVSNCGLSVIRNKLTKLEKQGVKITKVNPAFTSQTCSCCGYVDKKNRTTQSKFVCIICGFTLNADINAARNIMSRRSRYKDDVSFKSKTNSLLFELFDKFIKNVKQNRIGERSITSIKNILDNNPLWIKSECFWVV